MNNLTGKDPLTGCRGSFDSFLEQRRGRQGYSDLTVGTRKNATHCLDPLNGSHFLDADK
jgi:hypothetical protein